jgi:hypothetical protein
MFISLIKHLFEKYISSFTGFAIIFQIYKKYLKMLIDWSDLNCAIKMLQKPVQVFLRHSSSNHSNQQEMKITLFAILKVSFCCCKIIMKIDAIFPLKWFWEEIQQCMEVNVHFISNDFSLILYKCFFWS